MDNYQQNDEVLWQQFQTGDIEAFTQIVDKYIDLLYDYGRRFSLDSELIRDCIQDIFCTIWDRRIHLSAVSSVRFYLMKALRQKIIREIPKWNRTLPLNSINLQENFSLELAWEGHRKLDVFRNKLNMDRNYPGTHLLGNDAIRSISWQNNAIVEFIPASQILVHKGLEQNPQ